ncbi:universal stress protein [Polaribacter sp. Hel1_85]|uniref:universal stress protein n=1 Tax=Polaribacter sp. Hel1_85 TaxID=1250005 RepID=UPI00052BFD92|nr:universal stress protein [Polaribacter sp. Hel1_85]KGL62501.1 universal stress protein UspA [Polaribacter sp. Hel1_85]
MKNILLPTDFSDNSWNAIQYAVELFKDEKCNFFLLNTYTPMIYNLEYTSRFGLIEAMGATSKKSLNELQEKVEKKYKNPNHTYNQISTFNTLTHEIDELYDGNVIDFIVMGTKGATGLSEILFGSNTVHVIKNAKCPVLAIPSDFAFETPREILFPSDYEISFHKKQIKQIVGIATSHKSRVHILNASFGYGLSENQEKNKQKLEELLKDVTHLFHSVSNESVTEAITEFQTKERINLLVMINNKHSFFENLFFKSKINQIGFHLKTPFLVIPSSK